MKSSTEPHLVWIYPGLLAKSLDAATWIDTTRELRRLGWRVTLVAAGSAEQNSVRGLEVFCIPRPEIYLLRQFLFHVRLLRIILRQWTKVDIILFYQMSSPWLFPLRLLRGLMAQRRPLLVMDIRSLHMPNKQTFKDRLRGFFEGLMTHAAKRWVDGYLVITQRMAESLRIPSRQLLGVWPSGVNLEQFASAQTGRLWPVPGEPIHLIYIGALHYERNLMALSQAVMEANAEGMAFHLTLVGDGTASAELAKFAAQNSEHIRVIPPIPHEHVPAVLAQSHVGVLPFPDEEKFRVSSPIKLFEYMAAGLPILATRISCHTDVIGSGSFVFWAEQADISGMLSSLRLLSQNRYRLSSMGIQAALAAKEWTWQESAGKLRTALESKMGIVNGEAGVCFDKDPEKLG